MHAKDEQIKSYKFDTILSEKASQISVFNSLKMPYLINKVFEGYQATVITYGLTGSGKTYTMCGSEYSKSDAQIKDQCKHGLVQLCIEQFFQRKEELSKEGTENKLYCSYYQLYNEKIYDLLNCSANTVQQNLKLRWTKNDNFIVENLFIYEVKTKGGALNLFKLGNQNKIMASHLLNMQSSRSHTVFTIISESTNCEINVGSQMLFVDLAGSERFSYIQEVDQSKKLINEWYAINAASKSTSHYLP
jgi:Kinesin motor domain